MSKPEAPSPSISPPEYNHGMGRCSSAGPRASKVPAMNGEPRPAEVGRGGAGGMPGSRSRTGAIHTRIFIDRAGPGPTFRRAARTRYRPAKEKSSSVRWLEIEPNDRHEAVQPRPPLLAHAQPGKPPRQPSKESEGVGGPGAEGIEGTIADPCRIFPEGQQTQDQQCHASAHADRRDNDEQAVIDESAQHERSVRLLRRWIRRRDRVHQRQRRW